MSLSSVRGHTQMRVISNSSRQLAHVATCRYDLCLDAFRAVEEESKNTRA